jgi:hypothetical protein
MAAVPAGLLWLVTRVKGQPLPRILTILKLKLISILTLKLILSQY